jgi:hypothetical protein
MLRQLIEQRAGSGLAAVYDAAVGAAQAACTTIWRDKVPQYFQYTAHGIEHSEQVCLYLDQIVAGFEAVGGFQPLLAEEIVALLVAGYLHDIGMQLTETGGVAPEMNREVHERLSATAILAWDQYFPTIAGPYPQSLWVLREPTANIIIGHRIQPLGRDLDSEDFAPRAGIRVNLLAAALRIADELDLTWHRSNPVALTLSGDVSPRSAAHHAICSLVTESTYDNGTIVVTAAFPSEMRPLLPEDRRTISEPQAPYIQVQQCLDCKLKRALLSVSQTLTGYRLPQCMARVDLIPLSSAPAPDPEVADEICRMAEEEREKLFQAHRDQVPPPALPGGEAGSTPLSLDEALSAVRRGDLRAACTHGALFRRSRRG